MKLLLRQTQRSFSLFGIVLMTWLGASAQSQTILPVPFVSAIAGIAVGSGNTACTGDLANQSGQHLGDGCVPTQATFLALYDTLADPAGNIYVSENGTNNDVRVVYNGGSAFTTLLKAANAGIANFTPTPGRIYTFAGGTASALTAVNKIYYCGNVTNGQQALDSLGDGCPAAQAYVKPRGMALDKYGNVYMTSNGGGDYVRVVYAGGAQVASLIALETPGVIPVVGSMYKIAGTTTTGYSGDGGLATAAKFIQLRYITVDGNGNIYVSDGTTQSTSGGSTYEIAGNNVRQINGTTGIITTFAGENTCVYSSTTGCPYGSSGDGGPATAALLSSPYALFVDASNNVYLADYYNSRIRVIYAGGTIGGITSPVVGNIYTYAGGGTSTANGSAANQVAFNHLSVAGIDAAGNIYAEDGTTFTIWKFDGKTAIGNVIAGGPVAGAVAKNGFSCAVPAAATPLPLSTDNVGDGCPALQATLSDIGHLAFDQAGNFYLAESGNVIVRKFSYNTQFAATAAGTAATQPLAFESLVAAPLSGETFSLEGSTTSEYSDAGTNDSCSVGTPLTVGSLCVVYVSFKPAQAGQRPGSLQLSVSTPALSINLSGIGVAANIAIDTGTRSVLGTGLAPAGVAADLLGNVYVSDTTGNRVLKGSATGTTLTALITGLSRPAQIAVSGLGNLYVADSGNNRVLQTTSAGVTVASLGTGLAGPKGVAVDGLGDVYVADTGNNRVLQLFSNGTQLVLPVTGLTAPTQLALDASGNLYIVDSGNTRIVEFAAGIQSVLTLDSGVTPTGVAVDPAGDVYVLDSTGQRLLCYPAGASTGNILLGNLTSPVGLATDAVANLFVADSGATGAIELRRSLGNFVYPLTNVGQTTTESITLSNVGNAALSFAGAPLTVVSGSALYTVAPSSSNGCAAGTSYTAGQDCNFTASFTPMTTGSSTATVTFNTNANNTGSASALLSGTGLLLVSTTTTLAVSAPTGTVFYDQTVVLTAKLTPSATTTTPTGTFTFTIDGKTQSPQQVGTGTATLSLPNLAAGAHTISITYSGDGTYASSAATTAFTVNQAVTTTTLTINPVNTAGSLSLSFAATVASSTATGETGTVSFYSGSTLLGTAPVSAAGTASISPNPAVLSYQPETFTAVYSGNANFAGSTSAVVAPVSDFVLGYSTPTVSTSQGGVANISFTIASLFGGVGTVTPSCTNLPANTSCRFQPETLTVGSASQTEAILIYTNVLSTLASNEKQASGRGVWLALGLPIGLGLLLMRRRTRLFLPALLLIGFGLCTALSGCGSGANASNANSGLVTPAGTYAINVVFTGSAGLTTTHSIPVTFTVVADSGPF